MAVSVTAARPCLGIIDNGVDVDLFKGILLETPLRLRTLPLELDGEGLDLGVNHDPLGVDDLVRTLIGDASTWPLLGESSDNSNVSDMASVSPASFALRRGDMASDAGAARIGSPGCATMISSEYSGAELLAIGNSAES